MLDFFLETIKGPNLPATIMLVMVMLYWCVMITGIFGMDLDADLDLDIDADLDADFDGHIDGGIAADVLAFFHVGEVPVMILASFFVLFFWIANIVCNHYFNPEWSMQVAAIGLVPNLLVGLIMTKLVIWPLAPVFRGLKETDSTHIVGNKAVVDTRELNGQFGRVSIENDGPRIVVNAITANGQRLAKDQPVKVIRFDEETGVYIVEPVKPEKIG